MSNQPAFAAIDACAFYHLLQGLVQQRWTGVVQVATAVGEKQVYLADGDLVFASSTLVEDRLGEVIYRAGGLSLDQLTAATAQVARGQKFGQVLVATGVFDHVQLWNALKLQVTEIVRSLFMEERLTFEFSVGTLAPTAVGFTESTHQFLAHCLAYGTMYQGFAARLTAASTVTLRQPEVSHASYAAGTFRGDLLRLIGVATPVADVVAASKQQRSHTVSALLALVIAAHCECGGLAAPMAAPPAGHLARVRAKMDTYALLVAEQRRQFAANSLPYPVAELGRLATSLNHDLKFPALYLDADGQVHPDSLQHIYNQCRYVQANSQSFEWVADNMIRFSLQMAGDRLPLPAATAIDQYYRKISAHA